MLTDKQVLVALMVAILRSGNQCQAARGTSGDTDDCVISALHIIDAVVKAVPEDK